MTGAKINARAAIGALRGDGKVFPGSAAEIVDRSDVDSMNFYLSKNDSCAQLLVRCAEWAVARRYRTGRADIRKYSRFSGRVVDGLCTTRAVPCRRDLIARRCGGEGGHETQA